GARAFAASSRFTVPCVLVARNSAAPRAFTMPAACTIASTPTTASATFAASSTPPYASSTFPSDARNFVLLLLRTSARTAWPAFVSCSTTWLPKKPLPPVTRTFIGISSRSPSRRGERLVEDAIPLVGLRAHHLDAGVHRAVVLERPPELAPFDAQLLPA